MEKNSFKERVRRFFSKLPEFFILKEKRSLKERRTVLAGLPEGIVRDRRCGDDRRLAGSGGRTIFFYPF